MAGGSSFLSFLLVAVSVVGVSLATYSEALWSLFHAHLRLRRDVQLLGAGERERGGAREMH